MSKVCVGVRQGENVRQSGKSLQQKNTENLQRESQKGQA